MKRKDLPKSIDIFFKQNTKQYKYLYRRMLDLEIIKKAYKKLRKGKTKRKEIQYIDQHLDEESEKMLEMVRNTRPNAEHPELGYRPRKRTPKIIHEHGKERKIYMPEIHEQWLHHIIVLVLEPIITATSYPYSCGSFPKRGAHYGKKKLFSWIKRGKGIRNFAKIDIRHFYDNVRINILLRELSIRIKDNWFLYIIRLCLSGFKKGIPLGFYISQWLANYLLEPLDVFITKQLGFNKMERYMDDIVIMDDNKKKLHFAISSIRQFLGQRLRLKLKRNYQVCKFWYKNNTKTIGREINYMWFLFYRNRIAIRKNIMISAVRLAKKLKKRKNDAKRFYSKDIRGMLSYIGWFDCTNTYNCYKHYIKPCVNIKKLKKIVSVIERREKYEELENGKLLRNAA